MKTLAFLFSAFFLLLSSFSFAGSATWDTNPGSDDWNTANNWTPAIVPTETATFAASSITDIFVSADAGINAIVFDSGASAFVITTAPSVAFTISGSGITNSSGVTQNFVSGVDATGNAGSINFNGNATVNSLTSFTTEANPTGQVSWGSSVAFNDSASAGNGVFYNNGAAVSSSLGGLTIFYGDATAADGVFVSNGGSVAGASGGATYFTQHSDAGNAVITANSATANGAGGGYITFQGDSLLDNATLIANGGLGGAEGGIISFGGYTATNNNRARIELFGNATMYVSQAFSRTVDIGSLEGKGIVSLSSRELQIGRNGLSTIFSGVIEDDGGGGTLTKIGRGTLTLTGGNTFSGATTVMAGTLSVGTRRGSATGTGPVNVNAGTLAGKGTISGAVTVGTGSGSGASLAPGTNGPDTLTISNPLTFKADGSYNCDLSLGRGKADQVNANGVTIESGAQFVFLPKGNQTLTIGTVFTVINNTATTPISGVFANLPDGSRLRAGGGNKLRVSYEGGDGNDLTLTVVP